MGGVHPEVIRINRKCDDLVKLKHGDLCVSMEFLTRKKPDPKLFDQAGPFTKIYFRPKHKKAFVKDFKKFLRKHECIFVADVTPPAA